MALSYLLDTNICIYIIKKRHQSVLDKFADLEVGEVGMSAITYGELLYGAYKSKACEQALATIETLCDFIPVMPLSVHVSDVYAQTRTDLERQGQLIGNNDLWIAAHCLDLGLTLVTNNEREFSRVQDLTVENWVHMTS